jgi:hypothetical protein
MKFHPWTTRAAGMLSAILAIASIGPSPARAAFVYDFESPGLTLNAALDGQDNWKQAFAGLSGPFLKTGVGTNGTRVAEGGSAGQGGRVDLYGSRINDASFSYPAITGTETAALVQVDMRYSASPIQFSPAVNPGGSGGTIVYGSPRLGFIGFNGSQFSLETVGSAAVPGTFALGEWVRLRLVIDWTHDSTGFTLGGIHYNSGSGTLQYMNLSDGETTFTNVTGLTNVELNASNYNYYARNASAGAGLLVRLDTTSSQLDNIFPNGVPEPASAGLLAIGGAVTLLRRRRVA